MRNFSLPQDQVLRYHGTIVQFDGIPVYITVTGDKWNCYKPSTIQKPNAKIIAKGIDPYDSRIDVSSIPLGYVNIPKYYTTRYVARRPVKGLGYKQGVHGDIITVTGLPDSLNGEYFSGHDILYMEEFEDCVLGKFPSLDKALNLLPKQGEEQGSAEIAIDRHIALSVDKLGIIKAYYRNDLVGWMAPGKRVLNVPSSSMGWIVSHHLSELAWEIN